MAFTHSWDDTYPSDKSGIANQLGVYLRQLKTDTQERMAVISGFGGGGFISDAVPSQWNGMLFFSMTGFQPNVLQFQNPQSFVPAPALGRTSYGPPLIQQRTGTTNQVELAAVAIQPGTITQTSRIRVTVSMQAQLEAQVAGLLDITLSDGTTTSHLARGYVSPYAGGLQNSGLGYLWGGFNTPTTQVWIAPDPQPMEPIVPGTLPALGIVQFFTGPVGGVPQAVYTSFDPSKTLVFQLFATPGSSFDTYTIFLFSVEVR